MAEEKIAAVETAEAQEKAPAKKPAAKRAPAKKAAAKEAAKKAPAKKKESEKLTIKLTRSLIGRGEKQIATAKALGLKKAGDVTTQPDNAATRGKINRISHMVEVVKA